MRSRSSSLPLILKILPLKLTLSAQIRPFTVVSFALKDTFPLGAYIMPFILIFVPLTVIFPFLEYSTSLPVVLRAFTLYTIFPSAMI